MRRPESILVVVLSDAGETLLLCRRRPENFWQSVTGSLLEGETPAAAARRELQEETGLTNYTRLIDTGISREFEILPAWRNEFPPGVTHNLEYRFVLLVTQSVPVVLSADEHCGYAWVSLAEAHKRAASHTNREALEQLDAQ